MVTISLITSSVFSKVLQTTVGVNIITPYSSISENCKNPPCVLYLLHGLFGSQHAWVTGSNIVRYAKGLNLLIVMPDLNNTFYVNSSANIKYLDFAATELPSYIENTFRVSKKREDTFICGISMGGYGAFRIAFSRPEKFSLAISLSGALDLASVSENDMNKIQALLSGAVYDTLKLNFGEKGVIKNSENDLFYLAKKISSYNKKPALLQYCGKQDYLYNHNINFKNHVESLGFDSSFYDSGGFHDWDYWDKTIKDVLCKIKSMNSNV